jgi:hypothetical protein
LRHNRLINSNPNKSDEVDVEGMCLLLRLGKLKEVWMGQDRTREIYRALVYELLNSPRRARAQSADQGALSAMGRAAAARAKSFLQDFSARTTWRNYLGKKSGE